VRALHDASVISAHTILRDLPPASRLRGIAIVRLHRDANLATPGGGRQRPLLDAHPGFLDQPRPPLDLGAQVPNSSGLL